MTLSRLALLMSSGLLAASVAWAGQAPPSSPGTTGPAQDARARQVLETSCTACHDLGVLTARPHARTEWPSILDTMIGNGANLTDDEHKLLAEYLGRIHASGS